MVCCPTHYIYGSRFNSAGTAVSGRFKVAQILNESTHESSAALPVQQQFQINQRFGLIP